MKTLYKNLIYILPLVLPTFALAAGIQVSPAKLDFSSNEDGTIRQLLVVNPTADVQIYDVYADDFKNAVKITPESFTLEAGSRKNVSVSIDYNALSPNENVVTAVSVVSRPLADSKLNLATGAKIPLTISFYKAANKNQNLPAAITLLAVIILILVYYLGIHKQTKNSP